MLAVLEFRCVSGHTRFGVGQGVLHLRLPFVHELFLSQKPHFGNFRGSLHISDSQGIILTHELHVLLVCLCDSMTLEGMRVIFAGLLTNHRQFMLVLPLCVHFGLSQLVRVVSRHVRCVREYDFGFHHLRKHETHALMRCHILLHNQSMLRRQMCKQLISVVDTWRQVE